MPTFEVMAKSGPTRERRNRERRKRGALMAGTQSALLPLPRPAPPAGNASPISASATSAIFSTDIDSFDFKIKKPEKSVKSLMGKLQKAARASS